MLICCSGGLGEARGSKVASNVGERVVEMIPFDKVPSEDLPDLERVDVRTQAEEPTARPLPVTVDLVDVGVR